MCLRMSIKTGDGSPIGRKDRAASSRGSGHGLPHHRTFREGADRLNLGYDNIVLRTQKGSAVVQATRHMQ